jgi:hypothetical protein
VKAVFFNKPLMVGSHHRTDFNRHNEEHARVTLSGACPREARPGLEPGAGVEGRRTAHEATLSL